jgi:PAS domain S-box-containing protein
MEIINLARTGRVWITPLQSVGAALSQMAEERLPGLVVMDNGRICGITTLLDLASRHPNRLLLDARIMEAAPFPESMDVVAAWQATRQSDSVLYPVVDHEGSLKGLLTREDLCAHVCGRDNKAEGERNLDEIYPGSTDTYDIRAFNDLIIENMGSGLMVIDNRGIITRYNQVALSMLGLPLDKDLTGLPITKIHPALEAFKTVSDSYRTLVEMVYPLASGQKIHLGFISRNLLDRNGKRQGIVTLFRDLSELKENQEKLSRNGATLRALMNATTERMLLTDIDGNILAVNQVFAETVGKSPDELIGNCVWNLFSTEVVRARKIHVDKMVETGRAVCFEDTRNGRYLESCMYPILDSRGQVELVATFSRDVTEARLAAINLEKKQEETLILKDMLQNVMDNMMTGLLVTDTAGNISLINRSALETLEITENECLDKPIESISADLAVFKEALPPKASGHEAMVRLANGKQKPLGFSSTPFLEINGKNGVITIFRDLTEIKEIQKVLKAKERLATIGEFSRNIAHEIKNPLFSISASLQTLERNMKRFAEANNSGNDPTAKLFGILYAETERINRLLDTLSRMGRNQHLCLEPVNLEELIEFVLMENTGLIAKKKIRINRYFSKTVKRIRADRDKMIQIISNLLLNAIAFSPSGGEITLSLQNGSPGSTVEFCVGDAGPGIAENDLQNIFEPFFSTRPEGSGLGLAITRWIVEIHGGTIFAKNKKTRGALFIVTLPCTQKGEV